MSDQKDAMNEALRKTELALAHVLQAADFIKDVRKDDPEDSRDAPQRQRLRAKIIDCIRKLRINRELGEHYYVAVAGGQSAGKTRLIRELYGLDPKWLPDNEGRGERLPVFVIETPNIREPYATQIVLDPESREIKEEPIDHAAFRAFAKGAHPNQNALYPKLHVPERYFPNQRLGFVLLPGYEVLNEANMAWQEVMRHTLRHALGCLFVTDKTRLADNQQIEMQRALSQEQFGDREFAIAISKTENSSIEARDELCRTAYDVFNLKPEQHNQVVCTGIGADFVAQWSTELMLAVNANSRAASGSFESRLKDLIEVAETDILRISDELDRLMQQGTVESISATSQRDEVMQLFDDAQAKYRRRLDREMREHTQSLASSIQEKAIDAYIKEEEGFHNTVVENVKRFFNTTSGERERIHVDRVISRWNSEATTISDFAVLSKLANDRLEIPCDLSNVTAEKISSNPIAALGYDEIRADIPAAEVSDSGAVREYLVRLLKPQKNSSPAPLKAEDRPSFTEAVKLIPALTMEYLRVNQAVAFAGSKNGDGISTRLETESLGQILERTVNGLPQFKGAATNLLRTIGCILAVDVAIDGTVDTIPGLIHAIFGGGAAAAGAGGTAAGTAAAGLGATLSLAAAGVIGVGYVGYQATTAAQRADAAHRGFIRSAVSNLAAKHVDRWMDIYDDAMERVADRLRESLTLAYNLDTHVAHHDSLLRAMSQLETARLNLVRNVSHAQHTVV
ncbi:hypothetical protein [Rhodanobacter umsongensis]